MNEREAGYYFVTFKEGCDYEYHPVDDATPKMSIAYYDSSSWWFTGMELESYEESAHFASEPQLIKRPT